MTTPDSDRASPGSHNHGRVRLPRYLLTVLLLGLGVHLLLPQLTSLQHSFTVLRQTVWWLLALAVFAQVMSYVGSGLEARSLANLGGKRVTLLHTMVVAIASGSVGMVAGGIVGVGAASYQWLRDRDVEPENAALAGSLPVWVNNGIMALAASFGLVRLLARGSLTHWQIVGYVLVLVIIAAVFGTVIWSLGHRKATERVAEWVASHWARLRHHPHDPSSIEHGVARFFGAWETLRAGAWRGPVVGALMNNGFDLLCLSLLFRAARNPVDVGVLLTGYGLPLLLGKMVFLPGGVGVVEASMTGIYNSLGVPAGVIVVVILVYRLLSFWLPSILGFLLVPYLNSLSRTRRMNRHS